MRTWQRAERDRFCGTCRAEVFRGDPILRVDVQGMTRGLFRGECCAGQAPPDLPRLIEREAPHITAARDTAFKSIQQIPITRTRGALKTMAREYLPHPND